MALIESLGFNFNLSFDGTYFARSCVCRFLLGVYYGGYFVVSRTSHLSRTSEFEKKNGKV